MEKKCDFTAKKKDDETNEDPCWKIGKSKIKLKRSNFKMINKLNWIQTILWNWFEFQTKTNKKSKTENDTLKIRKRIKKKGRF